MGNISTWESLAKRLLAANQIGLRISASDGHRWIVTGCPPWETCDECSELMECSILAVWKEKGIVVKSKVYGSVADALDTIDAAVQAAGQGSLQQIYDSVFGEDQLPTR